jgi:O-antigen/teichoic acid export membrane protein
MDNKTHQVKNAFIYLLPVVIGNALPLITLPIFTRILTKEDFGTLALVQIYAIFVSGLTNFGMTAAYDRNYFQYRSNDKETAQLLYSTLFFVFLNFIILVILTYLFKERFSELVTGSTMYGDLLFFAFCGHFFYSINYYYLTFFKNSGVAKNFTFFTLSISFINFFLSIVFITYLRTGVIGLVYAQLYSGFIIFCLLTYKFIRMFKLSFNKLIFIESFKISYPLTPRIFFGVISTQFDKYMIGLLATAGGVGIYSIGQKVANIIFVFMTAIQNVFSPEVYKRMFDKIGEVNESLGEYLTPFAYVIIAVALLIAVFAEEIIFILTPPAYHGAIDIVIILSIFYGFLFFGKLNGNQLIFMKKTHITSLLTILSIALNVGFNIPFIMEWGAMGAAWGTLLAGLISGAISLAVSQHYYKIKWEYKKIGAIFLIFFSSAILMIFLRNISVVYEIRVLVKIMIIALYSILGFKLRIITIENYILIKNMILLKQSIKPDHT